jgi:hypothetical protein
MPSHPGYDTVSKKRRVGGGDCEFFPNQQVFRTVHVVEWLEEKNPESPLISDA